MIFTLKNVDMCVCVRACVRASMPSWWAGRLLHACKIKFLKVIMSDSENTGNFDDLADDSGQPLAFTELAEDLNGDTGRLTIVDNTFLRARRRRIRSLACLLIAVAIFLVVVILIALFGVLLGLRKSSSRTATLPSDPHERALALLEDYPLIDG